MKKSILALAAAAVLGFAGTAFAQTSNVSATVNGSAGVHMASPIHLYGYGQDGQVGISSTDVTYLEFGTLIQTIPNGGPGQSYATVHPWATAYGPTDLSNFTELNAATNPPASSRWTATGEPNTAFSITIPNSNLFLESPLVTGINVYAASWNWQEENNPSVGGGPGMTSGQAVFDGNGKFNFAVGGTLTCNQDGPINADLEADFPVTVNY